MTVPLRNILMKKETTDSLFPDADYLLKRFIQIPKQICINRFMYQLLMQKLRIPKENTTIKYK